LDDSMAPGSARKGGDSQLSGRGVGVEAACPIVVRPDYPVLSRRRHDCHSRMAPSAQRRANRAGAVALTTQGFEPDCRGIVAPEAGRVKQSASSEEAGDSPRGKSQVATDKGGRGL